jgi:transcriptional regulator with XRE-family HTH domain
MSFKPYKSYNFINKDPVVDRLRTIIADEGMNYKEIHEASGVSTATMWAWFKGPTRRPTHAAVAAVAATMGYSFELTQRKSANNIVPLRKVRKAK